MLSSRRSHIVLWCSTIITPIAATGQTCISDTCFVDRNATGEIVLGAIRGGLATFDYDDDGWLDLLIGERAGFANHLFRNVPDPLRPGFRTFVDVTAGSGLDDADGTARESFGVSAADYDNDGDQDIYIVGRGTAPDTLGLLYRNDGGGNFTNVSVAAGIRRAGGGGESSSWIDYDLDGDLDLMLTAGIIGDPQFINFFENNGNGTFTNRSNLLPPVQVWLHCYSSIWFDYDRDGWSDCFLIGDRGTQVVMRNVSDGIGGRRFANAAAELGYMITANSPMGASVGDFDGDGDLDIGISDAVVGTYMENRNGQFVRVTPFSAIFGWGVAWLDVDNDADLDFYTGGSWGAANLDNLQRNDGDGVWTNISPALNGLSAPTQYTVQLDFNNDGRQDIITVNPIVSCSVYENVSTTGNHWLKLRLVGDGTRVNRNAVGARIALTAGGMTQVREVVNGSSTAATEDLRQHFGLGPATTVDRIEIVWPRFGSIQTRTQVVTGPIAADQIVTISPEFARGDLNCDGFINNFDIDPLVLALSEPGVYSANYPGCDLSSADIDRDGLVTNFDIDPFVLLLSGL